MGRQLPLHSSPARSHSLCLKMTQTCAAKAVVTRHMHSAHSALRDRQVPVAPHNESGHCTQPHAACRLASGSWCTLGMRTCSCAASKGCHAPQLDPKPAHTPRARTLACAVSPLLACPHGVRACALAQSTRCCMSGRASATPSCTGRSEPSQRPSHSPPRAPPSHVLSR